MTADPIQPPSLVVGVIRSLRPKQWVKNVLVFAAPVAAGMIDERSTLLHTPRRLRLLLPAAASATYLLNDAVDVEADRRHPVKRHRPIAAGSVPVGLAFTLAAVLLVGGCRSAFLTDCATSASRSSSTSPSPPPTRLKLKHMPVLDIVAVAVGLRAAGDRRRHRHRRPDQRVVLHRHQLRCPLHGRRQAPRRALRPRGARGRRRAPGPRRATRRASSPTCEPCSPAAC